MKREIPASWGTVFYDAEEDAHAIHREHIEQYKRLLDYAIEKIIPDMIDRKVDERLQSIDIAIENIVKIEMENQLKTIQKDNTLYNLGKSFGKGIERGLKR